MSSKRVLRANTPGDLVATVPVIMGFHPDNSVVMLCFPTDPSKRPFHARIDLPSSDQEWTQMTESLLGPTLQHSIDRVAFVAFTPNEVDLDPTVRVFRQCGINVIDAITTDGNNWSSATGVSGQVDPDAYKKEREGRTIHGSREDLRKMLEPAPSERTAFAITEPARATWTLAQRAHHMIARLISSQSSPTNDEVAFLIGAAAVPGLRSAMLAAVTRENVEDAIPVFVELTRRTIRRRRGDAACMLSFVAWLSGHGALAWVAHDVAEGHGTRLGLLTLVGVALESAIDPATWPSLTLDQVLATID